jgi:hypothetical protein
MNEFDIVDSIILAAKRCGEDGRGRDGLVGYYRRMILKHPKRFIALFDREWRETDVPIQLEEKTVNIRTLDDLREHARKVIFNNDELAIALADEAWPRVRKRLSTVEPQERIQERIQQEDKNRRGVQAMLRAMQQIGEDGRGSGGIDGCLYRLLIRCPGPYSRLLRHAEALGMRRQEREKRNAPYETLEQLEERRRKLGIPESKVLEQYHAPLCGKLPPRIVEPESYQRALRASRS